MSSGFNLPKPLKMSGDISENWKCFNQSLNIYLRASGQDSKSDDTKIAMFLNCIGDDGLKIYNTFKFDASEETFEAVVKKFQDLFNPKKNILYSRQLFYQRDQKKDEPFESFLIDVQTLSADCEFTDENEIIRDRLVFGSSDNETKQKIIKMEKLCSLEEVTNLFKIADLEKVQSKGLCQASSNLDRVKRFTDEHGTDGKVKEATCENEDEYFCGWNTLS